MKLQMQLLQRKILMSQYTIISNYINGDCPVPMDLHHMKTTRTQAKHNRKFKMINWKIGIMQEVLATKTDYVYAASS